MDGFKKRLNESIQFKLSVTLALAILIVAILAGAFSFFVAADEAHEFQDDTLRQIASLFNVQPVTISGSKDAGRAISSDEDARVILQYLNKDGGDVASAVRLNLPKNLPAGLQTVPVDGELYRVLVATGTTGQRFAVAQATRVRDEMARDSAWRTIIPFAILFPILLLVLADLVDRMFRPVLALAKQIDQRSVQELHPIEVDRFLVEIRPFAVAINRLLVRIEQAMAGQRRFVADAAHELRSPLTALSLQAEHLAQAEMSGAARERLATLRRGILRGRNLLDQMLTLARVQSVEGSPRAMVSVQQVYRQVLEDVMPLVDAKGIDIGVEGDTDAQLWLHPIDLTTLVKNLVVNAISYTDAGGRVDLSVWTQAGRAVLQIQDTGPGITEAERSLIFDPFYRSLGQDSEGAGLGLAIVKACVERLEGEITLGFTDEIHRSGLRVRVFVPLRAPEA
ncbi:MAG: two-component sensor histidine kinase [Hyphomicrobiales bacterium]|nr:two-component sensor histidine kinase [Hyphomicrobiales bacterium]MDE2113408.1 two-component sensor histidine kinase [Hyphomicrobiales bacterium]